MEQISWEELNWNERFVVAGNIFLAIGTMFISVGTAIRLARGRESRFDVAPDVSSAEQLGHIMRDYFS